MKKPFIRSVSLTPFEENSYISQLPIVEYLHSIKSLEFSKPVTFFVGENGTGKSTLIEAIAVCAGFNSEGGSKNFNFETASNVSNLHKYLNITKADYEEDGFFLRAESFFNVATQVDELGLSLDGYGGKSLHAQSHGEGFISLVQNRFRGKGLYILDEPESALSPLTQLTLLVEFKRLVEAGSQFIISTHSPILLAFPNSTIYQISDTGIEQVKYKDCDHYILTKEFLISPEQFMTNLFED